MGSKAASELSKRCCMLVFAWGLLLPERTVFSTPSVVLMGEDDPDISAVLGPAMAIQITAKLLHAAFSAWMRSHRASAASELLHCFLICLST